MAKAKTTTKSKSDNVASQIVKLRSSGKTWAEISETTGVAVGKAIFIHECETLDDDERFKGTDAAITKKIISARDKGMSWGQIAARAGWAEGRCKKVYFEAGGETVNVHRGGRYPSGADRSEIRPDLDEKAAAKPAKKATKKAAKKTAKSKAKAHTADSIKGKFVTLSDGEKFKVVEVTESNGLFEATDADGEEWGFELDDIAKVTAR